MDALIDSVYAQFKRVGALTGPAPATVASLPAAKFRHDVCCASHLLLPLSACAPCAAAQCPSVPIIPSQRVEEGRGLSAKEVAKVAKGRVWTGEQVHCWRAEGGGVCLALPVSCLCSMLLKLPHAVLLHPAAILRRPPHPCCSGAGAGPGGPAGRPGRGARSGQGAGGAAAGGGCCARQAGGCRQQSWVNTVHLIPYLQGVACHAKVEFLKPAEACLLCGPQPSLALLAPPAPPPCPTLSPTPQVYPERKSPLEQMVKLARGESQEGGSQAAPEAAPAAWAAAAAQLGLQLTAGEWALLQQLHSGSLAPQCLDPAAERLSASL